MMTRIHALIIAATGTLACAAIQAQPASHAHASGEHQDHMNRRFDPSRSASFDDPKRDERQKPDQVLAALGLRPSMKVADIGAGTGYFTVRLARHSAAPQVFAVDIEPKMLEHIAARAKKESLANIATVQASENSANLPSPVDLILMVNTYHHVANRTVYFAGLLKSLNPDGRVAIIDWKPGAQGGPPAHFRFSAEQIRKEMAKAGYRVLAEHDFLPDQTFQIFAPIPAAGANSGKVWDEIYSRPDAPLRTGPPPVSPGAVRALQPGKALDFGMGLGRNALYLASLGWDVTGVDLSDEALRQASEIARQ